MNFYNNSNSEFTDFTTCFQSYVHVITWGMTMNYIEYLS